MSLQEILGGIYLVGYVVTVLIFSLLGWRGGYNTASAQVLSVALFWPIIIVVLLYAGVVLLCAGVGRFLDFLWKRLKSLFRMR